jgi:hypothetical protein
MTKLVAADWARLRHYIHARPRGSTIWTRQWMQRVGLACNIACCSSFTCVRAQTERGSSQDMVYIPTRLLCTVASAVTAHDIDTRIDSNERAQLCLERSQNSLVVARKSRMKPDLLVICRGWKCPLPASIAIVLKMSCSAHAKYPTKISERPMEMSQDRL